jgi:lipopolysaccharide transport system permease protein
VVFKARWGMENEESKAGFAIILFVGMIVHGLFAECVNRAPSLILSNVNYVKKVVFPLEILPWVAMGSALFHAMISLVALLINATHVDLLVALDCGLLSAGDPAAPDCHDGVCLDSVGHRRVRA